MSCQMRQTSFFSRCNYSACMPGVRGYCIWDEDKQAVTAWMSSEGVLQAPFRAPLTEDPSFIHFREAYERGETFFVEEIGGEDIGGSL